MAKDRSNVTALLDDNPAFSRQNRGGIFMVIKGPDRGEIARLDSGIVTFGSGPQCTVVLTDKTVSRLHVQADSKAQRGVGGQWERKNKNKQIWLHVSRQIGNNTHTHL